MSANVLRFQAIGDSSDHASLLTQPFNVKPELKGLVDDLQILALLEPRAVIALARITKRLASRCRQQPGLAHPS